MGVLIGKRKNLEIFWKKVQLFVNIYETMQAKRISQSHLLGFGKTTSQCRIIFRRDKQLVQHAEYVWDFALALAVLFALKNAVL